MLDWVESVYGESSKLEEIKFARYCETTIGL